MKTKSQSTIRTSVLLLLAAFVLTACGDDAQEGNGNNDPSNNDPSNNHPASCSVLLEETLVPFGTGGTRLLYEFDYPDGWQVDRTSFEALGLVQIYRSISGRAGNEVQFSIAQTEDTGSPNYDWFVDSMGYEHIMNLDFGGQTVEVVGKMVTEASELWNYMAWLPTPDADDESFVLVNITMQQGTNSQYRCPVERKVLFDEIVSTIRPNPETTFGQGG